MLSLITQNVCVIRPNKNACGMGLENHFVERNVWSGNKMSVDVFGVCEILSFQANLQQSYTVSF